MPFFFKTPGSLLLRFNLIDTYLPHQQQDCDIFMLKVSRWRTHTAE
jgi:hypothetical protein